MVKRYEEAFHIETQMPNKCINISSTDYLGQGAKPWFIAFGGVNNPTMADFKLTTWCAEHAVKKKCTQSALIN